MGLGTEEDSQGMAFLATFLGILDTIALWTSANNAA